MLRRLAVGEHLMLGGDNMDAALARRVEEKLFPDGNRRLSATQWTQAIQAARTAKEALLGNNPPERHGVSLVAEGSRLLGGSLSTELTREEVEAPGRRRLLPARRRATSGRGACSRMALQELGLPYAQDAAITRHLAAFLAQHAAAGFAALGETAPAQGALPRPDAILLNGGVFNSPQLVRAAGGGGVRVVAGRAAHPAAAARLAGSRGGARRGLLRAGAARASAADRRRRGARVLRGPAARRRTAREQPALCLIPRGFEEGRPVDLGERSFTLTLGRPVQFTLYSTTSDRIDKPGDVVPLTEELKPLPPIHTLLKGAQAKTADVPVHLQAALTEIGTLELFVRVERGGRALARWSSSCAARAASAELTVTESMPARFAEAKENVERVYGNKPLPLGPKDVKQLVAHAGEGAGPARDAGACRCCASCGARSSRAPPSGGARRTTSASSTACSGYTLRPGFGYPLDDWRAEQTFTLFEQLVQLHTEKPVWIEFWVMWRRIAGGLTRGAAAQAVRLPEAAPRAAGAAGRAAAGEQAQGHSARGPGRDGAHGGVARAPGARRRRRSWADGWRRG